MSTRKFMLFCAWPVLMLPYMFFTINVWAYPLFCTVFVAFLIIGESTGPYFDNSLRPKNFPLIYFVLNAIVAPIIHFTTGFFSSRIYGSTEQVYNKALIIYTVAFVSYFIGSWITNQNAYQLAHPRNGRKGTLHSTHMALSLVWVLIGIGSFFMLFGGIGNLITHYQNIADRTERFTSGMGRYMIGMQFLPVGISFYYLSILGKLGRAKSLVLLMLLTVTLSPLMSYTGSRWATFSFFVSLLMVYSKRYVKRQQMLGTVIMLLILLAVLLPYGYLRSQRNIETVAEVQSYVGTYFGEKINILEAVVVDFARFDVSATLISYIDSVWHLELGSTFLQAPLKLLPSSVYNRSRKRTGGTELLGQAVYGQRWGDNSTKASPLIGELYANFDVLGVVFGFVLIGIAWGITDKKYCQVNDDMSLWVITNAALLLYFMFNISWDLFIQKAFVTMLPIVLYMQINNKFGRRSSFPR